MGSRRVPTSRTLPEAGLAERQARRFVGADRSFSVLLRQEELAVALELCRRAARCETGGVIIGRYTVELDCAIITELTPPPPDSRAGATRFDRGTQGLRQHLDLCWRRAGTYYLGEWHFHPYVAPEPSSIDLAGISTIARDRRSLCPEPLLLIIGGDPAQAPELRFHVCPRGRGLTRLVLQESDPT